MEAEDSECSSSHVSDGLLPGKIRKRRFSTARIQPTRVKKVMQSDEDNGRMVASVPVAVGSAMEHFAEQLLIAAARCVQCSTSRTLSPMHMKQVVSQLPFLVFLEPLMKDIPLPKFAGEHGGDFPSPEFPTSSANFDTRSFAALEQPHSFVVKPEVSHFMDLKPFAGLMPKAEPSHPSPLESQRQQPGEMPLKRRRGRPRKEQKEKFMMEDEQTASLENTIPALAKPNGSSLLSKDIDDRLLMPPPNLKLLRAVGRPKRPPNLINAKAPTNGDIASSLTNHDATSVTDPAATVPVTAES